WSVFGWSDWGCASIGWPFGSIRSGTEIFGSVAAATAVSGSLEVPACAGAIAVAVSAAQISNAERREANILTVENAVNLRPTHAIYLRLLVLASLVIPRLAWHSLRLLTGKCPPLFVLEQGFTRLAGRVKANRSFQR